ncbi:hypothetical protein [Phenylobacterium montanum]|uniref:Uncharacterized protein n=1 Tax=Phenylobacterium montanum TaxID=2823693 RepID=A0A975FXG7_9CAUL|nr:hypothetical protein [Caulobacter sp. S6]QUD86633.1 hypothetical protein KCG34_16295 [Caulobacter sp. S6]
MEPEVILVALVEALHDGADGLVEELAGALRDAAWIEPVITRWRADAALIRTSAEATLRWIDEVALPTVRATAGAPIPRPL